MYSWSRLSAALSGLAIATFLGFGGTTAVFVFIACCMAIVIIVIGGFGLRTRGRSLEAIAAGEEGGGPSPSAGSSRAPPTAVTGAPWR